jgi:hypothetical protein
MRIMVLLFGFTLAGCAGDRPHEMRNSLCFIERPQRAIRSRPQWRWAVGVTFMSFS